MSSTVSDVSLVNCDNHQSEIDHERMWRMRKELLYHVLYLEIICVIKWMCRVMVSSGVSANCKMYFCRANSWKNVWRMWFVQGLERVEKSQLSDRHRAEYTTENPRNSSIANSLICSFLKGSSATEDSGCTESNGQGSKWSLPFFFC